VSSAHDFYRSFKPRDRIRRPGEFSGIPYRTGQADHEWLAAVADVGEVEIDLQPAGLLHESSQSTLIAPFVVYNDGFAER